MRHRHLQEDVGSPYAAIDDILGRGSFDDWLMLRDAAERDRSIAGRIVQICLSHKMYGTSPLWIEVINRLDENRR